MKLFQSSLAFFQSVASAANDFATVKHPVVYINSGVEKKYELAIKICFFS
jgi:hypothetical protein